jgi:hypothetical protein
MMYNTQEPALSPICRLDVRADWFRVGKEGKRVSRDHVPIDKALTALCLSETSLDTIYLDARMCEPMYLLTTSLAFFKLPVSVFPRMSIAGTSRF